MSQGVPLGSDPILGLGLNRVYIPNAGLERTSSLAMTHHKAIRLQLAHKQWELAEVIAVPAQDPIKLLRQLEQDRIIQRRKGWFMILDPEKLSPTTDFGG